MDRGVVIGRGRCDLSHSADLNIPTTVVSQLTGACFRKVSGASHVGPSAVRNTPTNGPIGRDFGP